MVFNVTRHYRSDVGYLLDVSTDLTDVTLVSEDTYGADDDNEDEEDNEEDEEDEDDILW